MVKGWRNDPHWVEHYQKRDSDRLERQFQRIKSEHEWNMMGVELEARAKRNKFTKEFAA